MSLFGDFLVLHLPRYGLCNKLITWAKAYALCELSSNKMVVRGWAHFSLGVWLRREKSKRWYSGYFRQTSWLKYYLIYFFYQHKTYSDLLQSEYNTFGFDSTPYISDLPKLTPFYEGILREFWGLINKRHIAIANSLETPVIGVHIRRGDFLQSNIETDLDYFKNQISNLRNLLGESYPVILFSDGRADELKELLSLSNVKLCESKNDLVDLLHLSKSKIIITSKGSSFSYWAAFISKAVVIHHPSTWVKECRPNSINSIYFEGIVDFSTSLPPLFVENLNTMDFNN